MAFRKSILIIFVCLFSLLAKAQIESDYQKIDSLSYDQYQKGEWKNLVKYSEKNIADGIDFPLLRLRVAYADFMLQNYSNAAHHYEKVLENDSYNETAKYYLYLCYKYLNRDLIASVAASKLDNETKIKENLKPFGVYQFDLESSYKYPNLNTRGNATYLRAGLGFNLGWHAKFYQSIAFFNQNIKNPQTGLTPRVTDSNSQQFEYYAKLGLPINEQLSVIGAFHYLNTNITSNTYQNTIGFGGLKYDGNCFNFQADASFGYSATSKINQYNATLGVLPLGNLNLYSFTKGSFVIQNGNSRPVFSEVFGFKAAKNLWLEANGTFGGLDNYLDADALYIYNALDISQNKLGATLFFTFTPKSILQLNYSLENKIENTNQNNYLQHSITGGITWKF
jgi:hypothetical protein